MLDILQNIVNCPRHILMHISLMSHNKDCNKFILKRMLITEHLTLSKTLNIKLNKTYTTTYSIHPEKCFVESTEIWLAPQKFLFKYGSTEILFELTKKNIIDIVCNSNKKILNRQQKNGFAN